MPSWRDVLAEHGVVGGSHDVIRRKYLRELADLTGRNTIIYYSGWLSKSGLAAQNPEPFSVNDMDKNGFMATIHGLDRSKGLDVLLHTPGGSMAATESLVEYLHAMFGRDIRAIVPQIALSAGTMIACACREIVMGKHSSIGPIDPQMNGLPAHGVVEEFRKAAEEIKEDPAKIPVWQPIIAKYHPTLIGECQKAIAWSTQMVRDWLVNGMFEGQADADAKASRIMNEFADHALTLSHDRHIGLERAQGLDLEILPLEDNQELQDAVLTVHHACIQTLTDTNVVKLIENQNGVAFIQNMALPAGLVLGGPPAIAAVPVGSPADSPPT